MIVCYKNEIEIGEFAMQKFSGKILVVGCGSVSQCTIPLLLKHFDIPADKITIMDYVDNRDKVKDPLSKGVRYVQDKITRDNYDELLSKYVTEGDLFIDLAWDIDTVAMLDWCHHHGVLYINSSVEMWDPYTGAKGKHPTELTLYVRQMAIRDMVSRWDDKKGPSAVVDHGANPGLVSHFTKQALEDIAKKILEENPEDTRKADLEIALNKGDFPRLAFLEGVKTIHISERDTQVTDKPKEVNEFVNTWSVAGMIEEAIAPAELGWGTHERLMPKGTMFHKSGPKNQVCLTTKGMNTWVRSWVPCGEITGMVIRHGEAFSIADYLTIWENSTAIYRPTVHYAYCCADVAVNSLHELEMRQYVPQPKQRIMGNEILSGRDELGCLLMGHDFKSWWIGSLLDIEETRRLAPGQNATTLQVAISVVAATIYMVRNPKLGVSLPDHFDHNEILKIAKPYLGPFVSYAVDWTPLNRTHTYLDYGVQQPEPADVWQFTTFLVSHHEKVPVPSTKRANIPNRK